MVSTLVLFLRFNAFDWIARDNGASISAWSLCDQQKKAEASSFLPATLGATARYPCWTLTVVAGHARANAAIDLLQGLPLKVIPLQVVDGSFESDRGKRDSGVLMTKGILELRNHKHVSIDRVCDSFELIDEHAQEADIRLQR